MTRIITVTIFSRCRFQYRKRYEVTCDIDENGAEQNGTGGFNTASGMRSHVTREVVRPWAGMDAFQYRKRYEVTCDTFISLMSRNSLTFQYRKRYEVTCDSKPFYHIHYLLLVSIPQAV